MFTEKEFEDILVKYSDLLEPKLKLKGRQITVFGRRMDLLFEDGFGRKLIIELKNGPIKDEHIGQVLSYEGTLLSADDPTVRVMLVGTRVPPNIQKSLDHHGIAWKEITHSKLKTFLQEKEDYVLLGYFNDEAPVHIHELRETSPQIKRSWPSSGVIKSSQDKKIGIKIYKGAVTTNRNVQSTLLNEVNLSNIDSIENKSLKEKLIELRNEGSPLYAWAALSDIQKNLPYGMKILFIIVDTQEAFLFEYVDSIYDDDSEFQRKIARWVGKGFENVVFLRNRKEMNLSKGQVDEILKLVNAVYYPGRGFAGYKYYPVLTGENVDKLFQMLTIK